MKNRALLAGGAVVLVVILGWYMFLFKPKGTELSNARAKVAQLASEQQKLEGDLARLQELDRNRPLRVAERQRLAGLIPERDELAGFLIAADEIATRSGLQWLSIAPAEPTAGAEGAPSVIALDISLRGTFFQLLDYIGRLENLRRLVVVDALTIQSAGDAVDPTDSAATGSGVPTLSVTVTARMFTTAPPIGTATTAPPAAVATTAPQTATTVAGATTSAPAATSAPAVTTTAPAATSTTGGA